MATAKWLHGFLERYKFPQSLPQIPEAERLSRFKPVFRDRDELTAGNDLGDAIKTALTQSENLIVICSPRSAKSHWVNQEVLFFKRLGREDRIFPVTIDGEPFAEGPNQDARECLPPALRFELNDQGEVSEHQAQLQVNDLRQKGGGRVLEALRLLAHMTGVNVDGLVRANFRRARKRVAMIIASATVIVSLLSGLTWTAVNARAEADARRADAEGLIKFMLTDLKEKLDEVGRLDVLQSVGIKATEYYDSYLDGKHDDDALGRRATALRLIGLIEDKSGRIDIAEDTYVKAFNATGELVQRNPQDFERIYDHAQSAFWVADVLRKQGRLFQAKPYYESYVSASELLLKIDPNSFRARQELAYAQTGLGQLLAELRDLETAKELYLAALPVFREIAKDNSENADYQFDYGDQYGLLATLSTQLGEISSALIYRTKQNELFVQTLKEHPDNYFIMQRTMASYSGLLNEAILLGDFGLARVYVTTGLDLFAKLQEREANDVRSLIIGENIHQKAANLFLLTGDYPAVKRHMKSVESIASRRGANAELELKARYWNRGSELLTKINLSILKGELDGARQLLKAYRNIVDSYLSAENSDENELIARFNVIKYEALLDPNADSFLELLKDANAGEGLFLSPLLSKQIELVFAMYGVNSADHPQIRISEISYEIHHPYLLSVAKLKPQLNKLGRLEE